MSQADNLYLQGVREGKPKPTKARFALAHNVKILMENYRQGFKVGISSREIAQKTSGALSYKTIDRIKNPYAEQIPNLESLDELASFFGVEVYELLVPRQSVTLVTGIERQTAETALYSPNSASRQKKTKR